LQTQIDVGRDAREYSSGAVRLLMMYTNRRAATLSQHPKGRPGANVLKVVDATLQRPDVVDSAVVWTRRECIFCRQPSRFHGELGLPAGASFAE
jgi:hypothetical protein